MIIGYGVTMNIQLIKHTKIKYGGEQEVFISLVDRWVRSYYMFVLSDLRTVLEDYIMM